jgi:hypothetical protein
MTSRIVAGIIGLLIVATSAQAFQKEQPFVLFSRQDEKGVVTEFRVSETKLVAMPGWSPESEPVPLNIAAAVTAAKKKLKPQRPENLLVVGIQLTAVNSGKLMRWFYLIQCYDSTQVRRSEPPAMQVAVVLMDGSVVEPVTVRHPLDSRQ